MGNLSNEAVKYTVSVGDQVLVTTDEYFMSPSGILYKAAFGTLKGIYTAEETLGVKPNGKSTNWYAVVGNMTLAGCQIHYVIKTNKCNLGETTDWCTMSDGSISQQTFPYRIYNADGEYV